MDVYLDIETTGLSRYEDEITVIGIGLVDGRKLKVVQLVDEKLTRHNLIVTLKGVHRLYTYNGSQFDLPFIHEKVGVDLTVGVQHHDLMFACWNKGLYGGFKAVEKQLGICRKLTGIDGLEAIRLWSKYKHYGDQEALKALLAYNEEDVYNLKALKSKQQSYRA